MSKTNKRTKSGKRKTNKRHIQKGAGWFPTSQQPTTSQPTSFGSYFNLFGKKKDSVPCESVPCEPVPCKQETTATPESSVRSASIDENDDDDRNSLPHSLYNKERDSFGGKKRHSKKSKKSKKYSTKKMR